MWKWGVKCYIYVKIATFEQDRLEKILSHICNIVKWKMLQSCCENVTQIVKNVTFLLWKMLHELWKMLPHILWKILHLDVTRIVKNVTTVSTSVQHRPKVFYLCYLNNIFSCISFRGGRNRINHREPLTTDHSSTLFSLVEAEKDIDIKVCKLFIYNNNKNHKRD